VAEAADKVAVVVVAPAAVVDRAVVVVAASPVVGAAARVAVEWEAEEVAVVVPAVAGAAGIANSFRLHGAPKRRPFFSPQL